MSYTGTLAHTASESFTVIHARELASRVMTDLRLFSRFYGHPSPDELDRYNDELVLLLKNKYLLDYEFGFKRNDQRVVSLYYKINACGDLEGGSPGGVFPRADVSGASYFNFMNYNASWYAADATAKARFRESLPFQRSTGSPPTDGNGYWINNDRGYAAGGYQLTRATFRPY